MSRKEVASGQGRAVNGAVRQHALRSSKPRPAGNIQRSGPDGPRQLLHIEQTRLGVPPVRSFLFPGPPANPPTRQGFVTFPNGFSLHLPL